MSYDINFWKWRSGRQVEPQPVYERLSASAGGDDIEELEDLPVEQINQRLVELYPDYKPEEPFPMVVLSDGTMEVSIKQRGCRFDFRGGDTGADKAKIFEVMTREFSCWCYDPQDGQLHAPEASPPYAPLTPEQKAFIEKNFGGLDMMSMARHLEKRETRARQVGCIVLIVLVLLLGLAVWGAVTLIRWLF